MLRLVPLSINMLRTSALALILGELGVPAGIFTLSIERGTRCTVVVELGAPSSILQLLVVFQSELVAPVQTISLLRKADVLAALLLRVRRTSASHLGLLELFCVQDVFVPPAIPVGFPL